MIALNKLSNNEVFTCFPVHNSNPRFGILIQACSQTISSSSPMTSTKAAYTNCWYCSLVRNVDGWVNLTPAAKENIQKLVSLKM